MKKILLSVSVIALLAAGCNSAQQPTAAQPVAQNSNTTPTPTPTASQTPSNNPTPTPKPPTPTATPKTLTVLMLGSNSTLGQYLVAPNTQTLYYYSNDSAGVSNCTGSCLVNWPPYTVPANTQFTAIKGINGKIGFIGRPDGSLQLTYNNKPLYFWYKGNKAGDTSGNQLDGFFVARP